MRKTSGWLEEVSRERGNGAQGRLGLQQEGKRKEQALTQVCRCGRGSSEFYSDGFYSVSW